MDMMSIVNIIDINRAMRRSMPTLPTGSPRRVPAGIPTGSRHTGRSGEPSCGSPCRDCSRRRVTIRTRRRNTIGSWAVRRDQGRVGTGSCEREHRERGASPGWDRFARTGGLPGTETRVPEHLAGAQAQPLTIGRLRGADGGAGARSEVSHSCEPVPNVLPNVRVHEWEHSDSHRTVPPARSNPPERRDPYPAARRVPR